MTANQENNTQNKKRRTKGNGSPLHPKRIESAARDMHAWELRVQGYTVREIAREMKVSVSTAHGALERALKSVREEQKDKIAHCIEVELDRLDAMIKPHLELAKSGDVDSALIVLKIQAQRQKFLPDLAPEREQKSGEEFGQQVAINYIVKNGV